MTSVAHLNRLIEAVALFQTVHPDMTVRQIQVFLLVATNPGVSQSEICERLELADSSVSRIIGILSEYGNRGTGPFNLVEMRVHKTDRRLRACFLTRKGEALAAKLAKAINE